MKTADALASLDRHQSAILMTMDAATAWVAGDPQKVGAPLARARWAVARQLRAYQVFKHTELFAPAIRHGTAAQAAQARAMTARCIATGEAFQDHLKQWSGSDVVGRWDTYRPAMLAICKRIRDTLAAERHDVAALLAKSERTRRLRE